MYREIILRNGKHYSSGAWQRRIVRRMLTLAGDKWEVGGGGGGDVVGVGQLGSLARSWALRTFTLVLLSYLPEKSDKWQL